MKRATTIQNMFSTCKDAAYGWQTNVGVWKTSNLSEINNCTFNKAMINCFLISEAIHYNNAFASRCITISSSEYRSSPSFQLHPWSIPSFILALNIGTYSQQCRLLMSNDETFLLWKSTADNYLNTISASRPSMYVNSVTNRDIVD